MIGKFIAKGIPKCSNCVYYRLNKENNVGKCIKFLGSHNKPIDSEIARYNDLMCGYYGTQHKNRELMTIIQPHI
jgi:hypothetical protein